SFGSAVLPCSDSSRSRLGVGWRCYPNPETARGQTVVPALGLFASGRRRGAPRRDPVHYLCLRQLALERGPFVLCVCPPDPILRLSGGSRERARDGVRAAQMTPIWICRPVVDHIADLELLGHSIGLGCQPGRDVICCCGQAQDTADGPQRWP